MGVFEGVESDIDGGLLWICWHCYCLFDFCWARSSGLINGALGPRQVAGCALHLTGVCLMLWTYEFTPSSCRGCSDGIIATPVQRRWYLNTDPRCNAARSIGLVGEKCNPPWVSNILNGPIHQRMVVWAAIDSIHSPVGELYCCSAKGEDGNIAVLQPKMFCGVGRIRASHVSVDGRVNDVQVVAASFVSDQVLPPPQFC